MQVHRIELNNFGRHRTLTFEPAPGLNGIIGPNGSGKSTVLAALIYNLTGTIPIEGNKEENICQFAEALAAAYVTGHYTHDGHTLEIVRALNGTKSQLKVAGSRPLLGERAVNAELSRRLGTTYPLIDRYVFVEQDRLYRFLDATHNEVAKEYARLFQTDDIEACWRLVGDKLAALPAAFADDTLLDATRRQVVENETRLLDMQAQLQDYDNLRDYDETKDPDKKLLDQRAAYERLLDEISLAKDAHEESQVEYAKKHSMVRSAEDRYNALARGLGAAEENANEARVALANWTAYVRRQRTEKDLEDRYDKLCDDQKRHPRPQPPDDYTESRAPERLRDIQRLQFEVAADAKFLNSFAAGQACCPTCRTPSANFEELLAQVRDELPAKRTLLSQYEKSKHAAESHDQALTRWQEWQRGYRSRLNQYEHDRADLEAEATKPVDTEEELRGIVDHYEAMKESVEAARAAVEAATTAKGKAYGVMTTRAHRVVALGERRAVSKVTQQAADEAQARYRRTAARLHLVSGLRGALKPLADAARDQMKTVKALEATKAAAARSLRLRNHLTAVRGVMHRTALPRLVATSYLQLLVARINSLLVKVTDFRVSTAADNTFIAHFEDGRTHPAYRLSVGQKVLLAIAFRVEVNALFTGALGLFCLDEPTQFLDADHRITSVELALTTLRDFSVQRGLQCFLVTHEERLHDLFDKVFILGAST